MVITANQAKIKNKQQHYHSLRTQASLENHNNNNTNIYTIINFREHIFRHKANALWCHHHLTRDLSSRNQIELIRREVWRRRNTTKVVTAKRWNVRERRHEEEDVLMNLPTKGENMAKKRRGVNRRTGKEANRQECEEECAREKIWLIGTTKNWAFYVADSKTVVKDCLRKCNGGVFVINSNVMTTFPHDHRW